MKLAGAWRNLNDRPGRATDLSHAVRVATTLDPDLAHEAAGRGEADRHATPFLDPLCDVSPVAGRTPHGARFREDVAARRTENHRDVFLAALAESGFATDVPIPTTKDAGLFRVGDLLSDAVANLHVDQRELDWTALSLLLYVPGRDVWTNKFGETVRLDDLLAEMLRRPLDDASCGGAHTLRALCTAVAIDDAYAMLTRERRQELLSVLARERDRVLDPAELARLSGEGRQGMLLLGHHLEWVVALPPAVAARPADVARLADAFLEATTQSDLREPCSWTRGLRGLLLAYPGVYAAFDAHRDAASDGPTDGPRPLSSVTGVSP